MAFKGHTIIRFVIDPATKDVIQEIREPGSSTRGSKFLSLHPLTKNVPWYEVSLPSHARSAQILESVEEKNGLEYIYSEVSLPKSQEGFTGYLFPKELAPKWEQLVDSEIHTTQDIVKARKYAARLLTIHEMGNMFPVASYQFMPIKVYPDTPETDGMGLITKSYASQLFGIRNPKAGGVFAVTCLVPEGLFKGHLLILPDDRLHKDYQLVLYGVKKQVKAKDQMFFGMLGLKKFDPAPWVDLQTSINFFSSKEGIVHLEKRFKQFFKELEENLMHPDIPTMILQLAGREDLDTWVLRQGIVRGLSDKLPFLVRALGVRYNTWMEEAAVKCRVPWGPEVTARYLMPHPDIFDIYGNVDVRKAEGKFFAAYDLEGGERVTLIRNPNGHRSEKACAVSEDCPDYIESGDAIFMSPEAVKEGLFAMGGGDFDDRVLVFTGEISDYLTDLSPFPGWPAPAIEPGLVAKIGPKFLKFGKAHQKWLIRNVLENQTASIGYFVNAGSLSTLLTESKDIYPELLEGINHPMKDLCLHYEALVDTAKMATGAFDPKEIGERIINFYDTVPAIPECWMTGSRVGATLRAKVNSGEVPMIKTRICSLMSRARASAVTLDKKVREAAVRAVETTDFKELMYLTWTDLAPFSLREVDLAKEMRQSWRSWFANPANMKMERKDRNKDLEEKVDFWINVNSINEKELGRIVMCIAAEVYGSPTVRDGIFSLPRLGRALVTTLIPGYITEYKWLEHCEKDDMNGLGVNPLGFLVDTGLIYGTVTKNPKISSKVVYLTKRVCFVLGEPAQ